MNPNIDPLLSKNVTGLNLPPLLDDIVFAGMIKNLQGFKSDEEGFDEEQAAINATKSLNDDLRKRSYAGARIYVRNSENEFKEECEDYGSLQGFYAYRSEGEFDGGMIVKDSGWEIGVMVSMKKPGDPDADKQGYVNKIISLSDPCLGMELHDDRRDKLITKVSDNLVERQVGLVALNNFNYLAAALRDGNYLAHRARGIGKYVRKIVNSKKCRDDSALHHDIEAMILHSYGSGRYEFYQTQATEFVSNDDSLVQQKINQRSRNNIIGSLESVIILPRFESRKKIIIPNFMSRPTNGDKSKLRILPLENNNFVARLSD